MPTENTDEKATPTKCTTDRPKFRFFAMFTLSIVWAFMPFYMPPHIFEIWELNYYVWFLIIGALTGIALADLIRQWLRTDPTGRRRP